MLFDGLGDGVGHPDMAVFGKLSDTSRITFKIDQTKAKVIHECFSNRLFQLTPYRLPIEWLCRTAC